MKTYFVRGKDYRVICAVHNEIIYKVGTLGIDNDTKEHILELVSVANSMAVNMEHALERKRDFELDYSLFQKKRMSNEYCDYC